MKGLKSKILIAVIMILSIVLGYQASVMAIGETFPRTSNSVPFWSNNHFILCREHTNSWKSSWYTCRFEHHINKDGIGTGANGAHGMAYFLHFGSKYGTGYGNEIQNWIWSVYPNFWDGQPIFNAQSSYDTFFSGVNTIPNELEQFINGNNVNNDITANQNPNTNYSEKTLKEAIDEGRLPIVDNYPHKFFTEKKANDADKRITEISAEEYNYLYQLTYILSYIDSTSGKCSVADLKKHMNTYKSELGMTIYNGDIPTNTNLNIAPAVVETKFTDDFYGAPIKLTALDLVPDGKKADKPHAWMWQYVDENNAPIKDNPIYYSDDNWGTTKFSDRVFLGKKTESEKDKMLSNYIDLYNGKYNISDLAIALEGYDEGSIGFDKLAKIFKKDKYQNIKGQPLFSEIYSTFAGYGNTINKIAEDTKIEDSTVEMGVINQHPNTYEFSGSTYQAAKLYQCLVNANIFEKCANRFGINSSAAKVSVDRENKEYIMGPFSTNYFSIKINGNNFMWLKEFNILLQLDSKDIILTKDEDGNKAFKLDNQTKPIPFETKNPYNLITSSNASMPQNGEAFYIQLSQEALEEIIGKMKEVYDNKSIQDRTEYFLTKNDKLGAQVQYEYIKYISATLHFLQGSSSLEPDGTFNRNYSQRLMTFDTELHKDTITKQAYTRPETYEFEVIKIDQNGNRLKGAEFALFGRYESGAEEIYVNLVNNEVSEGTFNETNKTFTVLDKVEKGNYATGDKGTINISNVPSHIVHKGKEYTLYSVVGKETKAPEDATLDQTHFEIEKIDNDTARKEITNITTKPYDIKIKKVDENGNPIAGVTFEYWVANLEWLSYIKDNKKGVVTTNEDGIAIIKDINLHRKLAYLELREVPDSAAGEYKYFNEVSVLYTPRIDKNGNVTLEFYDDNSSDDEIKNIRNRVTLVGQNDAAKIFKGIYRIVKKDGTELYGESAKNDIMCGDNAGTDIDIKIRNEKEIPYNIELLKFDENGKQSDYLDGTKFTLAIANSGSTINTPEIRIKNGIARIEGIKSYDDEVRIYITETPNSGFKTKLDGKIPVVRYKANSKGEIEIIRYNELALNPAGVSTETYKPVEFDEKTMTLRLGIINETEEYSLKFRKTDPEGNPLQGATFTLAGNCEKDENGNNVYTDIIGTDTSDEITGYMTYKGLTKTGNVTLYLYEESAPEGYLSIATKENPLVITYQYEPGSNMLKNFSITHNDDKIFYERELGLSTDEKTGDLGTLNSIFDLVNTPEYDLELFTKVDKNGNPIKDMKFNVTIENATGDRVSEKLTSNEEGKVIWKNLNTYGALRVEIKEFSDPSGEHITLEDTLVFTGITKPGEKVQWNDEITVIEASNNNNEHTYILKGTKYVDENGAEYPYVEFDEYAENGIRVINEEKPYNLVIKKVNSVDGTAIPDVEFTAVVFKNGTSEKQRLGGRTNEKGEIVLEGITIYNNADDNRYTDRLSVSITETVPEGYKWHEYGQVTYMQDYLKYSSNGDIEPLTGLITARTTDEEGNPAIKFLEKLEDGESIIAKQANEKSHDVVITNTPVYDLDLFIKAIPTKSELQAIIGKQEIDFSEVVANGGIKFTAEVKDANNNLVQSDVKVTFDENRIVAHDIDTSSLFTNNTTEVKGLKLVLTEIETSGLVKIDPITIVYDCKYVDRKFEPTKTGYEYQNKLYELKDFANKNVEIIKDLIYIDNEGKHVLVNESKTSEIILKKFDEKGNAINGVKFEGKIKDVNGVEQGFVVTTGEAGIDGEAVITNITLTGDVTLIITDESWKGGQMPEGMNYSELEFIKDDITISGIVINEDKTADCSNAKVDDAHKDQVQINGSTMAIEVTNKDLTYNIPIIKTSDEKDDQLFDQVMFDFIIKDEGADDNDENNLFFKGLETGPDERIDLTKINKFGHNLVLVINEVNSKHSDYKMLDKPVYVTYYAMPNYETNEVEIIIWSIKYEDGSDATDDIKIKYDKNGNIEEIQVINHREYSITLHKVMNVNDNPEELNEKVTLKGFVTTDANFVDEFKNKNMSYDEFNAYINENSTTTTEKTRYFNQETVVTGDGKSVVEIDNLDEFDDRVYVYFIEELQEGSSMTLINEVLNVSFIHEEKDSAEIAEGQEDKLRFDKENLDIEITVENDASAYKLNFLKVDSKGNPVDSLAKAKFIFTLKEMQGDTTVAVDDVTIKLDDDGDIDIKNSTDIAAKDKKYIVDFKLTEDGYIQLDINKFGKKLQLEIKEDAAPEHYITNENTFVIPYEAEPGKVTIGDGVSEGLTVNADAIGIEVKFPNDEEPYDLPIYKVLKEDINNEEGEKANNITFDVKFFELNGTQIMKELSSDEYSTKDGYFTVPKINKYGEYYITLEEKDTGNKNIQPIPGIHVFKITAEARDTVDEKGNVNKNAVKSIEYVGEGKIEQDKLKLTNNKAYAEYFKTSITDKLTGESIVRLEISNKKPVPYSLDLFKYCNTTNNPLNGVKFEASLTKIESESDKNIDIGATNLLGDNEDDYIRVTGEGENVKDGQIIFKDLMEYGTFKLTLVERDWPDKIKQTFDEIEIIYSTEDGKDIKVESVKVYFEGEEVKEAKEIVNTTSKKASLEIGIKNIEKKKVPLKVYKVKYTKDYENGELKKKEVPIKDAEFSGYVYHVGKNEIQAFEVENIGKGYYYLGDFYIDGEVKVVITEVSVGGGTGVIPPTEISINVNNEQQTVDSINWEQDNNVVESIENNTFKIIDPETVNPYITLAGIVWEDVKQHTKGEDSYQDDDSNIDFTEGLYDAGYDRLMEGVEVNLYQKGSSEPIETKKTDAAGQYVFDKEASPFEQYYITFNYADKEDQEKQYESVKYLVKDSTGAQYEGTLEDAIIGKKDVKGDIITDDIWARNSKAVTGTERYQGSKATTTKTKQAIGEEGAEIQYYPVQDMFTIDDEQVNLYRDKSGKYYTQAIKNVYKSEEKFNEKFELVTYSPLNPSHQHINLGLKLKATFDLRLEKDVEKIAARLSTGVPMNWKYGVKPASSMYQLELTKADIEKIQDLYIMYKIEIVNEGETAGNLKEIADYYNSTLLGLEKVYYTKVKENDVVEFDEEKLRAFKEKEIDNTTNYEHQMIPIQEYSKASGISKDKAATTGRLRIMIDEDNQNVNPGEKVVIFVKYKYNGNPLTTQNGKAKDEGSAYVTLGVAEIFSSKGNNNMSDIDSFVKLSEKFKEADQEFKKFYEPKDEDLYYTRLDSDIKEDDEDTAPAVKFVVGESGHTVSGNVFDDIDGNNELTGKTEGDSFIPDDGTIKGIKVALWNIVGTKLTKVQEVETLDDGSYRFTSVPAGEYKITFTYGDEKTVLPILEKKDDKGNTIWITEGEEISDITYERNNKKSYNAVEFESVVPAKNEGLYWYDSEVRGSDAEDDETQRERANNVMIKEDISLSVMDNELAEKMNAYKADLSKSSTARDYVKLLAENKVTAVTPKFRLNIEPTTGNEVQYVEESKDGTSIYNTMKGDRKVTPANIDFGIKGRDQSKLEVAKEVESIRIIGNDNTDIVNVRYNSATKKFEGTAPILKVDTTENGNTPWIQAAQEQIEGATLEVTYKITVKDKSEHNGETIVVTVADYIQNEITYIEDKNVDNGWNLAKAMDKSTLILINENEQQKANTTPVKINNKIDLTAVTTIATQDFELNEGNKYTVSKDITLATKLSDFNEMPEFENYIEVVQTAVKGELARKDADSIPGNYDPIKKETTEGNIGFVTIVKDGLERDTAKAGFSITPETGENRATYYILAISIIAVFAVGIILIKKKVLDR